MARPPIERIIEMIYGDKNIFAIEIGEILTYPGYPELYEQFRIWIEGLPIGDWEDRIMTVASIGYIKYSVQM